MPKRTIDDHPYDSGPANTHGLCIAKRRSGTECGAGEADHFYTEYEGAGPGDMHEPPAYAASSLQFNDDSYDHLHPFTD